MTLRVCPKLDDAGKLKQEMILVWYVDSGFQRRVTDAE